MSLTRLKYGIETDPRDRHNDSSGIGWIVVAVIVIAAISFVFTVLGRISSSDDVWFHVLNTPGSHIIVKAHNSKQMLNDYTILKIAKLAKLHSTAKNSTKVSVVYTLRKYVKRPNNTKPGFVVYKNETEIVVD